MKKVVPMLAAFGGLILVAFLALTGSSGSWHQRLTVTVDTPTGEVSSAAVSEIRYTFYANPSKMTGREVSYDLTGEATVVEVLPDRYLFAMIDGSEERFALAAMDRFNRTTRGERLRQTVPVILTGRAVTMFVDPSRVTSALGAANRVVFDAGRRMAA
jgi:predicted TPR repeat methyltransferase